MEGHRAQYASAGYCVLREVFTAAQLEPMRNRVAREVDELATQLHEEGKISELHLGASVDQRLALLGTQTNLAKRSWSAACQGPELFHLVTAPALLLAVEQLLGTDTIYFHGATCRPKLPDSCPGAVVAEQPYHQDSQYFNSGDDGAVVLQDDDEGPVTEKGIDSARMHIVSCWLPLCDTSIENGGLQMLDGSHRWGLQPGKRGDDGNMRSAVDPLQRRDATPPVAVDCRVGDIVCFSNLTYHGSGANHTSAVRWSLDWRYSAGPGSGCMHATLRRPWQVEVAHEVVARAAYISQLRERKGQVGAGMVVQSPGMVVPDWGQWQQASYSFKL
jgi:ectoine hydroxylase-related dioxygenase (phytanoyl-CoA dioxygenase family)